MENESDKKEFVRETVIINNVQQIPLWSPGVAGLLSFLIPGVGQMYKGKVGAGIMWLIFTTLAYFLLILPGIVLHIICIVTATQGNPYEKG